MSDTDGTSGTSQAMIKWTPQVGHVSNPGIRVTQYLRLLPTGAFSTIKLKRKRKGTNKEKATQELTADICIGQGARQLMAELRHLKKRRLGVSEQEHIYRFSWDSSGDLGQYSLDTKLSRRRRETLIAQTAQGLNYLHSLNPPVIHGDLRPGNILIRHTGDAVICDFSPEEVSPLPAASVNPATGSGDKQGGMHIGDGDNSLLRRKGRDVSALGLMGLEIMTGRMPFDTFKLNRKAIQAITAGLTPTPQEFPGLSASDELWDLFRLCWRFASEERPTTGSTLYTLFNTLCGDTEDQAGVRLHWARYLVRFLGLRVADLTDRISKAGVSTKMIFSGLSDVSRGKLLSDGRIVAIKALRLTGTYDQNAEETDRFCRRFLREVHLWSSLSHPHVVQLSGFAIVDDRPSLISPWYDFGNVRQYLQEFPSFCLACRKVLLSQVADGLRYLHSCDPVVVHGDLKAENVLIDSNGEVALCDFGLSKFVQDSQSSVAGMFITPNVGRGTSRWRAPEVLDQDEDAPSPCSTRSDIYSFASLGLEIMTGKIPFVNLKNEYKVTMALLNGHTPDAKDYPELPIGHPLWALFRRCWAFEPEERPMIGDLCDELRDLIC
ncbi:hypothetical protein FRB95_005674 [Tulasnella sp. JGI-2019a]|nr:hypothetical protein FRB95_005674 [Tulasnella sp. JGI-2019a]